MNRYRVPMHRLVSLCYMATVAIVAGITVWCFRSGLMWSGLCLIAVAGPLALLYWYSLLVNPHRASIHVGDEGLLIQASPFTDRALPYTDIDKVEEVNLATDTTMAVSGIQRAMSFGKYKNGLFTLKSGVEAVILTNATRVLCLRTQDRIYLLGPSKFEAFAQDIREHMA